MLIANEEESIEKQSNYHHQMSEMSKKAYNDIIKPDEADQDIEDKSLKNQKKRQEHKMTEEEKEMNRKILKNMSTKLNFVKNPRFRINNKCLMYSNSIFKNLMDKENPFVVEPKVVIFREYQMNSIYQIDLKLLNRRQLLTSFKYIPPSTENFSVKQIIYPKSDTSLVAPGMSAKIEILFHATSLDNFSDELTIITEYFAFKVPLKAIRDNPALTLDNPMDCKKCLIGDQVSMVFRCKNNGGDAHFKFVTENINESVRVLSPKSTNNFSEKDNEVLEHGPFTIFPSEFYLYRGMMIEIFVNFSPKFEGNIDKEIIICCDSKFNLEYKLKGEGILIDMNLISLDGIAIDESHEKLENLFFDDTFPFTETKRELKIKNQSSVEVKFHWNLYDIFSQNKFVSANQDDYFKIEPEEGTFQPSEEKNFILKFLPKSSKIYEQKIDLVIEDVPFQSIKNYTESAAMSTIRHRNHFTKGEPFILAGNSPYPSYPIFSFYLKGKGKLPYLSPDKSFINFGDVFIGQTLSRKFFLNNSKAGSVKFKLSKILEVIKDYNKNYKINNFFKDIKNFNKESIFLSKERLILTLFNKSHPSLEAQNLIQEIISKDNIKSENESKEKMRIAKDNMNLENQQLKKLNFINVSTSNKHFDKNTTFYSKNSKQRKLNPTKSKLFLSSHSTQKKFTSNSKIPNGTEKTNTKTFSNVILNEKEVISINHDEQIEFNVNFSPKELGHYKATLIFVPEDGLPFDISIMANVKGSKVKIDVPVIDLGLFQISQIRSFNFKIVNLSPVDASYLIKESKFKNINFENFEEENYKEVAEGIIKSQIFRNKINTIEDFENMNMLKKDTEKGDFYELRFSSVHGLILPHSEVEIQVGNLILNYMCIYIYLFTQFYNFDFLRTSRRGSRRERGPLAGLATLLKKQISFF
jgi:hypothetical protein